MNGSTAGLVSTDASSESDTLQRWRRALSAFNRAAQAAAEVGEWKLQREAEDATARCYGQIETVQRQEREEVQLRRVDGEDSQDAQEEVTA